MEIKYLKKKIKFNFKVGVWKKIYKIFVINKGGVIMINKVINFMYLDKYRKL